MTTVAGDDAAPSFRFKRRKTVHTKRTRTDDPPSTASHHAAVDATTTDAPEPARDEQEPGPDLKEILRNRKRPRDRPKETVRRPEVEQAEVGRGDERRSDRYTSRFVAQTGQVVDSGDAQM